MSTQMPIQGLEGPVVVPAPAGIARETHADVAAGGLMEVLEGPLEILDGPAQMTTLVEYPGRVIDIEFEPAVQVLAGARKVS